MGRVIHFEIHAAAPQKLIDFYTALFGWSFQKYGPMDYWVIVTGPEGNILGLMQPDEVAA
jgi:hypothetical protein